MYPINAIQSNYTIAPVANQSTKPRQGVFYAFDKELESGKVNITQRNVGVFNWFLHPFESYQLSTKLGTKDPQEFARRLSMYKALKYQLSSTGRSNLYQQLKAGRLTDSRADDNRSTLSHLHSMLTLPRAEGFNGKVVLEDTLRLLNAPQTITQKFGTLKPEALNSLMNYYNSGKGPKISQPIDMETLRVTSSATCVASSLMYYMVHNNPSEFVRHVAELTSPRLAFWEKASAQEISPEDPSQAAKKLSDYEVSAAAVPGTNGGQYYVKVDLPYSGVIRAINQQGAHAAGTRGVVEAAYQGALTRLAVRSYDPGLDMRVNADGSLDPSKGLEEDRKTLMECIIKDNGGVMSVTYQFTAADRNNEPYLMGYYRSFEQTTQDLMSAVDAGEDVIIGITDTDNFGTNGRINMGHEITVTAYERDKKTGEVIFTVADSDDNTPRSVKRRASEIIPKIHHAGFPVRQAQRIWNEINGRLNNQYMIPGPEDAKGYQLVSTVPTNRQQAFLQDYQQMLNEQEPQPATAAPQPAQAAPQAQQHQTRQYPGYATYPGAYYPSYYAQPTQNTAYAYPSYYGYTNRYPAYPNYSYNPYAYVRPYQPAARSYAA